MISWFTNFPIFLPWFTWRIHWATGSHWAPVWDNPRWPLTEGIEGPIVLFAHKPQHEPENEFSMILDHGSIYTYVYLSNLSICLPVCLSLSCLVLSSLTLSPISISLYFYTWCYFRVSTSTYISVYVYIYIYVYVYIYIHTYHTESVIHYYTILL